MEFPRPLPDFPDEPRVFPSDSDAAFHLSRLARWMQGMGIEEMTLGVTPDGRPYIVVRTCTHPDDAVMAACSVNSLARQPEGE